jgi:hypothetical protein
MARDVKVTDVHWLLTTTRADSYFQEAIEQMGDDAPQQSVLLYALLVALADLKVTMEAVG